jgi:hypothetical protein
LKNKDETFGNWRAGKYAPGGLESEFYS